ncbi:MULTISPECIES: SDR family NAD(P)-dependent oxidoreductase [unclassified Mycobacterium]|uniref:SDR family NAD(P)-dependent oxidoreductase n=1 Tax=unclassified Mycobacterium TaxID=2642494 RepID=UPI0029C79A57|nr:MULTISPECIES: SDR family NAD(P)-dependent oxidoreductase [unclassified Mycobacterium]
MSTLSFEGRVVVVTGAGGGLGRCHALEFARRGAQVVVNDVGASVDGTSETPSAAQAVVDEIVASGGAAAANTDSVATPDGGRAIIATAVEAFGRVDVLVNNAGILRDAAFKNMTAEQVDAVIDVHLRGAFHVTSAVWPVMREQNYGRIVMTTSGSGLFGTFGQANYGAAKTGLVGLMNVLAIEGQRNGILVNAISPIARTRMTENTMADLVKDASPEQVTPVVVFLGHEQCDRTAHIYRVGGAHVSRVFLAETAGIDEPGLTAESMAANIERIDDPTQFTIRGGP